MPIVKMQNVTKRYGDIIALDNINLEIEDGEIYGLLGPNGAGKTTAIRIICGLAKANRGDVFVFEKDISSHSDFIKQNIGIVPQELAIYGDLTAYENVSFFASLYGLKGEKLRESVLTALRFVGLDDRQKERASNRRKNACLERCTGHQGDL